MHKIETVDQIIDRLGLRQTSNVLELEAMADEVLLDNPKLVEDYCLGKEKSLNSLVGKAMAKTKGQANPVKLSELLRSKLCILKPLL